MLPKETFIALSSSGAFSHPPVLLCPAPAGATLRQIADAYVFAKGHQPTRDINSNVARHIVLQDDFSS